MIKSIKLINKKIILIRLFNEKLKQELIPSSCVLPKNKIVVNTIQITTNIVLKRIISNPKGTLVNKWLFDMVIVGEGRVEMAFKIEGFKGGRLRVPWNILELIRIIKS